ncbi:MAG: hypothetical protein K5778_04885 [Bacteroidaceae bacterium]|nr:hypothetical protein [Bacteroidaceae bacterium]
MKQRILIVVLSILPSLGGIGGSLLFAQNGVNSPYSRYGFGMMADRAMGFNKAMGGVAQGFRDGQQINVSNPASYSAVDSLTALFDLGLSVFNGNYKMGNMQQNAKNASFDYFAFQFRLRRGLGVTLGILPYTNISYKFNSASSTISGSETITSTNTFTGSGGLHQVFLGAGWQPLPGLSVGANVSYLYGDYNHTSANTFSESSAFSMQRSYTADIATYKLDFGMQLTLPLSKQDDITLGATYGLGHDIKSQAIRTTQTRNSSAVNASGDTLSNAFQLPHSIDVGITWRHAQKWRIGADFTLEKWANVRFPSDISGTYTSSKGHLNDRMKISLGGEYTPDAYGRKLLQYTSYRFGGWYSQTYARTNATDKPYEFGLTAGFSFPIKNRHVWYNSPRLNIALQWVHSEIPFLSSQTNQKNTLTENYLRLSVGLTFSERWFTKWRVQ